MLPSANFWKASSVPSRPDTLRIEQLNMLPSILKFFLAVSPDLLLVNITNHYAECGPRLCPFGEFDLLFGADKLNLKLMDVPIRYRERFYGETNIQRWRHGVILLRMVLFAARRLKFVRG